MSVCLNVYTRNGQVSTDVAGQFLTNIFRKCNADEFLEIATTTSGGFDYIKLKEACKKSTPMFSVHRALESLALEKKSLETALGIFRKNGVDLRTEVKSAYEIDLPGRYSDVLGLKNVAIVSQKRPGSLVDRVEAGFFKTVFSWPHNWIEHNNYKPPCIQEKKVELMVLGAGLHHAGDKLDGFIQWMEDSLTEDGYLLLRDHDASITDVKATACLAHSIVNACGGESEEIDGAEIRDFKSKDDWIGLLADYGFNKMPGDYKREDDPTHNEWMLFQKEGLKDYHTLMKRIKGGEENKVLLEKSEHYNTYLAAHEWYFVDTPEAYSEFLKGHSFYEFGYFSHMINMTRIYFNALSLALGDTDSIGQKLSVLFSEMNVMCLVLGMMNGLEYFVKGIMSLPLRLALPSSTSTPQLPSLQEHQKVHEEYVKFIKGSPFIKYSFFSQIGRFWEKFNEDRLGHGFTKDICISFLTGCTFTVDFIIKGIVAKILLLGYPLEENEDRILVFENCSSQQIADSVSEDVEMLGCENNCVAVKVRRFFPLRDFLSKISDLIPDIKVRNFSNHKSTVQIKVKKPKATSLELGDAKKLYTYPLIEDSEKEMVLYDAKIESLAQTIAKIKAQEDAELSFVYDY